MIGESALNRCVLAERSIIRQGCKLESVVMMGADFYDDHSRMKVCRTWELGMVLIFRMQSSIKMHRIGKNVFLSPQRYGRRLGR